MTKVDGGTEVSTADESRSASKIFIPDGSDIDASEVRIDDGASVANSTTADVLNYKGEIASVGKSINVFVGSGVTKEQVGSLMISMPIPEKPSADLQLAQSANLSTLSLMVFYHVVTTSDGFSIRGLIPESKLSIGESDLSFALRGSGNYQAAWVTQNATEELTVEDKELPTVGDGGISEASKAVGTGSTIPDTVSAAPNQTSAPSATNDQVHDIRMMYGVLYLRGNNHNGSRQA